MFALCAEAGRPTSEKCRVGVKKALSEPAQARACPTAVRSIGWPSGCRPNAFIACCVLYADSFLEWSRSDLDDGDEIAAAADDDDEEIDGRES